MIELKAVFTRKETSIETTDCVVDKVIRLSGATFDAFSRNLLSEWDFLRDNAIDKPFDDAGRVRCLLVVGEGRRDGILVNAEGAAYARHSSFLPNAEDLIAAQTKSAEITTPYPYLAQLAQNLTAAADYVFETAHADWPEGTEPARTGAVAVHVSDLAAKFHLPLDGDDGLVAVLHNMLLDRRESWFMHFEDGKFIYPIGKSAEDLERAQAAETAARREAAKLSRTAQDFIVWQVSNESTPGHWREDERYRKADDGVMYYLGGDEGQYIHVERGGGLSVGKFRCNSVNGAASDFADSKLTLDVSQKFGGYEQALSMVAKLGGARFEADILGEASLLSAAIEERREKLRVAALERSAERPTQAAAEIAKAAPLASKVPTKRADGYTSVKAVIKNGKNAPKPSSKAKDETSRGAKLRGTKSKNEERE